MVREILYKLFKIETPPCESCETLREQLAIANIEKKQMLESILSFTKPTGSEPRPEVNYEELKPKMMTWNVRRQMLEAEDRKKAQVLAEERKKAKEAKEASEAAGKNGSDTKDRTKDIEELEKELGIEVFDNA